MSKKFLQDMVAVKRAKRETQVWREETEDAGDNVNETVSQNAPEKKNILKSGYKLWLVALVSLVFLVFAFSYNFSKATVTVNPKSEDVVLNDNLAASQGGGADVLPFDLVVISGEENQIVPTTGEEEISQKAEGVVLIYNTFSSASQILSIDTRLEGSNGKIYKTQTKTTVPGMTTSGEPGSVELKIYASEAGKEYNSAPLDFKILGFKGTPKYAKFYGRSKGEITGGLKGKFPVIPDDQKAITVDQMKMTLQTKLLKKATDQIPDGFILFKDAVYLYMDDDNIDIAAAKENMLPIKMTGTLYGLLFDESKLTKKIAADAIKDYDGSDVFIPDIRDLTFSLSDKDNIVFGDVKNISFNLSGTAKIVWKVGADKLAADLLGKSKKDFNKILLEYPNINSADLVLSPVWKKSMPGETKNIKVIVNYPE